jgi:hypothetical protein
MKVNTLAYGIEVTDDDCENAFYILASFGQCGTATMVITQMAVDAGIAGAKSVLFDTAALGSGRSNPSGLTEEEACATIRETLAKFRDEHFVDPKHGFLNRDDIATIVEEFIDYYALET